MTEDEIKDMIKAHEGFRAYVYYDSRGFPTGGYGHCFLNRSPISHDVADLLFKEDYAEAVKGYNKLELNLDPIRRGILIDMIFNLGLSGLRGFTKMLKALRAGDYNKASMEMLDSEWAKQTKYRAKKLAEMMSG